MSKLTVAGIGPGDAGFILPAVIEKMKQAHAVIAAKRVLPVLEVTCGCAENPEIDARPHFYKMGKISETLETTGRLLAAGNDVVIAVSGDPLMYSLLGTIKNYPAGADWELEVIPGVGSLQMLGAAFGEGMEDAQIISVHGRKKTPGSIALAVTENPKVFFLCSKEQGPAWLSRIMLDYGLSGVTVCAGANLSYAEQALWSGSPAEMAEKEFPALCVAMIKNPTPRNIVRPCFLSDEDFERDKTPMTKEEIRVLILHKLKLHPDDIVWDVGAGTGSVSIECARQVPFGSVYAVERNERAARLIQKNKEKFGTENLHILQGFAEEEIAKLPQPDKVFIGGSGGGLSQILSVIAAFPGKVRVVVSAVTIETIAQANELLGHYDPDYDVVQATVGRGRKIGSYHIVDTNNPVMLFTAELGKR